MTLLPSFPQGISNPFYRGRTYCRFLGTKQSVNVWILWNSSAPFLYHFHCPSWCYKMKFWIFVQCWVWSLLGVEKLNSPLLLPLPIPSVRKRGARGWYGTGLLGFHWQSNFRKQGHILRSQTEVARWSSHYECLKNEKDIKHSPTNILTKPVPGHCIVTYFFSWLRQACSSGFPAPGWPLSITISASCSTCHIQTFFLEN